MTDDDLRALVQRLRKPFGARQLGAAYWLSEDRAGELALERRRAADELESLLARAESAEAECARLRQDAERYRAIRHQRFPVERLFSRGHQDFQVNIETMYDGTDLDAAIDRAIAEGKHD